MKHDLRKLQVQDLAIGDWVYDYLEIPQKLSTPMYVEAIYESGDIYLNFKGNPADPFETTIKNVRGISMTPDILKHFGFRETDHDVYELDCKDFKVRVVIIHVEKSNYVRAIVEHKDGGYRFDDNITFVHQLQRFVFGFVRQPLILNYQ